MQLTSPMTDALERYLDLSTLELKLTAENMANVDTPGYRTVGFDFAAEMRRSIGALGQQDSGAGAAQPQVSAVGGLLERPDGNNVSLDREGMKMAEAQLQLRTGEATQSGVSHNVLALTGGAVSETATYQRGPIRKIEESETMSKLVWRFVAIVTRHRLIATGSWKCCLYDDNEICLDVRRVGQGDAAMRKTYPTMAWVIYWLLYAVLWMWLRCVAKPLWFCGCPVWLDRAQYRCYATMSDKWFELHGKLTGDKRRKI